MKRPLSDLDQLKASENLKRNTLMYVMNKRKQHFPWKQGSLIACVCVLCFFLFQTMIPVHEPAPQPDDSIYAYVTFDINPSMELRLNENNEVIETKAYNADGETLLSQLSLTNLPIEESVSLLLSNENFQSYMKDGYLQVSVYSEDSKHSSTLETMLDETLSTHYTQEQYGCSCASKQDHEQANNHHMSFGRYQMIEMIVRIDPSYDIDDLQNTPMIELKALYERLSGTTLEEAQQNSHHGSHHP